MILPTNVPALSAKDEAELTEAAQAGSKVAMNELIKANVGLVYNEALKLKYRVDFDDMVSQGLIGLMRAIQRYDPTKSRLATFAKYWIRMEMFDLILMTRTYGMSSRGQIYGRHYFHLHKLWEKARKISEEENRDSVSVFADLLNTSPVKNRGIKSREGSSTKKPYNYESARTLAININGPVSFSSPWGKRSNNPSEASDFCVEDMLKSSSNAEAEYMKQESFRVLQKELDSAISGLKRREKDILHRSLLKENPETLAEIGKTHGITRERVRQIQSKILEDLRRHLKDFQEDVGGVLA